MANSKSKIEWTELTWNPITGCTKVSPGCRYCYAERMAKRLQAMGQHNYQNGFEVTIHPNLFGLPLLWKTPRLIFVNSMSDLFHEDVPEEIILSLFKVMRKAHWHTFQVLTKRAERLEQISKLIDWPENVWMGVSIESSEYKYRIDHLRNTGAKVKFLSLEPLLGPIPSINLSCIDWVIVGGESGPKSRPIQEDWAFDIRDQCLKALNVAFFFKQWGGINKKKSGRLLDNRTWDDMPIKSGDENQFNKCRQK
jgi:protein gp37